jgi:hypothetical protein
VKDIYRKFTLALNHYIFSAQVSMYVPIPGKRLNEVMVVDANFSTLPIIPPREGTRFTPGYTCQTLGLNECFASSFRNERELKPNT